LIDQLYWILRLPNSSFDEKTVRLGKGMAAKLVSMIRGTIAEEPRSGWGRDMSSSFGEDMVGGWLLGNGGLVEGLQKGRLISIPEGGTLPKRRTDWLLGKRIIVEVKTYVAVVNKGGHLSNTRQVEDYSLWRDEQPDKRAVVLARVAWDGNSKIEELFREDLRHFQVPVIYFLW
jgi:hypothetical protein